VNQHSRVFFSQYSAETLLRGGKWRMHLEARTVSKTMDTHLFL